MTSYYVQRMLKVSHSQGQILDVLQNLSTNTDQAAEARHPHICPCYIPQREAGHNGEFTYFHELNEKSTIEATLASMDPKSRENPELVELVTQAVKEIPTRTVYPKFDYAGFFRSGPLPVETPPKKVSNYRRWQTY